MTITITEYKYMHRDLVDVNGRMVPYVRMTVKGRGQHVATIDGVVSVTDDELIVLQDGGAYAMRDVVQFAKRGERGLSIVN